MKLLQNKDKDKNNYNNISKYLNLPFQMLATIALFVFAGIKLDHWLKLNFPVFTLILTILGVSLSMYIVIKEVKK